MHSTNLKNRGHTATLEPKGTPMAKDKYQANKERWKKENMKLIAFRLTKSTDADLIQWLEEHKPIQAYLKGLIRKDMES